CGTSAAARTLPHLCPHLENAPAAHAAQHYTRAGLSARDAAEGVLGAVRRGAIDSEQQIPRLQPRMLRGAAGVGIADEHGWLPEPELLCLLLGHILGHDANPAAYDAAVGNDVAQHAPHHVHRDGEADALDTDVLGDDGGVDADQCPARIDQGAAGVAEVDRRI